MRWFIYGLVIGWGVLMTALFSGIKEQGFSILLRNPVLLEFGDECMLCTCINVILVSTHD